MHNLGTVFRFEVARNIKKKSFWIVALAFPVLIGVVFCIIYFSGQATDKASQSAKTQNFSLQVTDPSHQVSDANLKQFGGTRTTDRQQAIAQVKQGQLDAYFYYPPDLLHNQVQVYGKNAGLFNNGRYEATAKRLLKASAAQKVGPETAAVLGDQVGFQAVTYQDGQKYDGFKQLIAPGVFLVLFYFLIILFGNRMLYSATEEKENRVIEMILTTIKPRALVIGKILSLLALALLQICIILVPVIVAYVLLRGHLNIPNLDLTGIPFNAARIATGAVLFCLSFMMFTGILVAIGAATPTAKDAGQYFGMVMLFIFGPLYAVTLFVSSPDAAIVRVLSFFPLTAPIPLMLRNAVGNLSALEAVLGIAILAVSAALALGLAVYMFRYGALEYSRSLKPVDIFRPKKHTK